MTAPIVCVGSLVLDTLAIVDRLPGDDQRVEADRVIMAGGGNASTAAVAIARLGVEVEFAGVVGDDDVGRTVVAQLEAAGVGTRHVRVRGDVETTHSVVIVSRETGTRTIITRPATVPDEVPTGYEWTHVDKVGYAALRQAPAGDYGRVSIDDGNPVADLDLALIDLYVPTTAVLASRFPGLDPLDAARAALAAGAGQVVATAGSGGSFAVSRDEVAFAPPLPIRPLSTLGAGDVFHGALLAAHVLGRPIAEAIRFANVTAALSCRSLDGRSGIPDYAEVESTLRELAGAATDPESVIRALRA